MFGQVDIYTRNNIQIGTVGLYIYTHEYVLQGTH